jgi:uncharacterized protein (TIGR04255 family)
MKHPGWLAPLQTSSEVAVTTQRPPLPDFNAPPLVEAVLGIQFEPLPALDLLQIGRLWALFRDEYPKHELQPMLAAQFETFERPVMEELVFPLGMDSPPARCWFLSEDETALVQVQMDRFILNWRQKGGKGTYPRYESMRHRLEQALAKFAGFLQSEQLGEIAPNQCEVTYVNHMEQGKGWTKPSEVASVFPGFAGRWSSEFLPEPEDVRAALRFVIPGPDQAPPLGRLHAQIEPRYRRQDNSPLLALTMTARLRPMAKDLAGAMSSLDLGREWIVRGFAALTADSMHKIWERRDA